MIGAFLAGAKLIVGRFLSHGGVDVLGKVVQGGTTRAFISAQVQKEEIKAGRDVAIEQIKAGAHTHKDEIALGLVLWPYAWLFLLGTWNSFHAMWVGDPELAMRRFDLTIQHLSSFPGWYTWGVFVPAVTAALGIRVNTLRKNGGKNGDRK